MTFAERFKIDRLRVHCAYDDIKRGDSVYAAHSVQDLKLRVEDPDRPPSVIITIFSVMDTELPFVVRDPDGITRSYRFAYILDDKGDDDNEV